MIYIRIYQKIYINILLYIEIEILNEKVINYEF